MNVRGASYDTLHVAELAIGVLIVLSILFSAGSSFFPNWSSISGIPSSIATVMPFLSLLLFFTIIFLLVKKRK